MKKIDEILTHVLRDTSPRDIDERTINRLMRLSRNELYPLIFTGQKWILWSILLPSIQLSTGEISKDTGIPSKNVSTQLMSMTKTGLVKFDRIGKLKKWYRIE